MDSRRAWAEAFVKRHRLGSRVRCALINNGVGSFAELLRLPLERLHTRAAWRNFGKLSRDQLLAAVRAEMGEPPDYYGGA